MAVRWRLGISFSFVLVVAAGAVSAQPLCSCGHPCTREVQDQVFAASDDLAACLAITAGPSVEVAGPAHLTLRSGQRVELASGFSVGTGGALTVWIDGSLFCDEGIDSDGDGFDQCLDCNDDSAAINPGAAETCDGVDNDCNGSIDDGAVDAPTWYRDLDGDTFGNPDDSVVSCSQPPGYVDNADDCDDNDDALNLCCDLDGDGWTTCDGDCCDTAAGCAIAPELVNPGALEILGNGVDDDCDAGTSDTTPPAGCSTTADFSVEPLDLAAAMDLCQLATASPPLSEQRWGLLAAELLLPDGTAPETEQLTTMQTKQAAVLTEYGFHVPAQVGATMSGLSSGVMRDANDPGFLADSTQHGYFGDPPAGYLAANGGALPSSSGCSGSCPAGTGANDGVNLRLTIRVPTNVEGLELWHRFFVADYPDWTCNIYNDFFLLLLGTTAPSLPADGNIAFDVNGNPLSLNNAFFDVCSATSCYTCPSGSGDLEGTGLTDGAGTIWRKAIGPVVPGETITLDVMVFDVSDDRGDVISLVDGFAWIPKPGTTPAAPATLP